MKLALDEQSVLATTPSAAVPPVRRRARDEKPLLAAGAMIGTPDGKILFLLRSDEGDHAGEWCIPGGKVEGEESGQAATRREVKEETGLDLDEEDLDLLDQRLSDEGVDFGTYFYPVEEPFDPTLDDEHDEFAWADANDPPQPLHPGVAATLRSVLDGDAEDAAESGGSRRLLRATIKYPPKPAGGGERAISHSMEEGGAGRTLREAPEARRFGLTSHDAKVTKEEARYVDGPVQDEPCNSCTMFSLPGVCSEVEGRISPGGHCRYWAERKVGAVDEKIALDRASVREVDQDGRLGVEITNISKANVCPYVGREIPGAEELGLDPDRIYFLLRDPEELERAAESFNNLPLLSQHVPVFAADYSETAKRYVVGATGSDATFERPYLRNSLKVWDGRAIAAIKSGEQKELSAGYHYRPDMKAGEYEGVKYDGVMRDIVGNHVALVREGRAGADVVVGDSREDVNIMTAKLMTRQAAMAIGVIAPFVRSKLAADSGVDLRPILVGLRADDFKTRKPLILRAIRKAVKGKLAKDATIGEVAELLDMIESHGGGIDDDEAPPALHEAMSKAAEVEPIEVEKTDGEGEEGMENDEEDTGGDDDPISAVEGFLKDKLSDGDLAHVCQMLRGGAKDEERGGEEKLEKLGAADGPDEPGGEAEQEHRDNSEEWRRGSTKELSTDEDEDESEKDEKMTKRVGRDQPPKFTGSPRVGGKVGGDRNTVTKDDMDKAIRAAADAVRKNEREIRDAERHVAPWVGQLPMTFDSAEQVYRKALKMMGVPGVDRVHPTALPTILDMQPKPGARKSAPRGPAADSSVEVAPFSQLFPDAARIRLT